MLICKLFGIYLPILYFTYCYEMFNWNNFSASIEFLRGRLTNEYSLNFNKNIFVNWYLEKTISFQKKQKIHRDNSHTWQKQFFRMFLTNSTISLTMKVKTFEWCWIRLLWTNFSLNLTRCVEQKWGLSNISF